ncbi:MAG: ABC transporter substrate-binding protein [Betaproteobacteria bacterium]|nr:MAG: ABC transporter substrate-binding protein [Betaproteobacteria bacterium]
MHLKTMSRRNFLIGASALGAASIMGMARTASAEPPPEIARIRLVDIGAICFAPQFVAEYFLRLEGFSEVEYVEVRNSIPATLSKSADFAMFGGPSILPAIDKGLRVSVVAGLHEGCWELFARRPIDSISELRNRKIAITALGGVEHVWLSSILAYVGMDPRTQVEWITTGRFGDAKNLYLDGRADAFFAFPPEPQELRANNVERVIMNTTIDRPWSQYFCCLLGGRNEFIENYPIATKRALRAILKAADVCSQEPERAARVLVEGGWEPRYDIALEVLNTLSYDRWRTDNPEDSIRFHALRLHEVGMIKSTPQEIIDRGTNFSFLNDLKKELKA